MASNPFSKIFGKYTTFMKQGAGVLAPIPETPALPLAAQLPSAPPAPVPADMKLEKPTEDTESKEN